ncbi:MAG: hypothetical protein CVU91_03085 [Firmicutes bacterium HGW-Firmicutes-16]|nr:MAG: hypothetical protein CVU91_03085 [Firmicutes bacterium HGW-Firmicutes-16]
MSEPTLKPNYKVLCFRITDIYILIMLFLFPLFTGFEGYAKVTFSKYLFFIIATTLWLVILIIFKLCAGRGLKAKAPSLVGLLLLLYLALCAFSAIFSPYMPSALVGAGRYDGLITTFLSVGIFWGVSLYARPKRIYIYAAAAAVTINCVIAVLQILGLNPLWLFPGDYDFYDAGIKFTSTFFGTIGNADLFSAYICLILPIVSVYYMTNAKRSLVLLSVAALLAFCLFVCDVSAGILAIAVTALIASPIVIRNGERLRRALELFLLAAVAAFLAVSLIFTNGSSGVDVRFVFSHYSKVLTALTAVVTVLRFVLRKSEFRQTQLLLFFSSLSVGAVVLGLFAAYNWHGTNGTLYELSQVMHGNIQDSFGSSRILIWRKTLELVPEHLLFGGGPGTLALRLDVNFSRFVEETGNTLSSSVDNAHNDYLGILVNTGLLSMIVYLIAQITSFAKAVKSNSPVLACLIFGLACYWVQAFFGLGLFLVSPLMWLFWGLLASELHQSKN